MTALVERRRDPRPDPRVATAMRHERALMRAAHPFAFPLLDRVPGPVRRVPGLGVLVKDAALLRGVLIDTAGFTKNGPGAPSDLWTPVLGPSVLLNMEGADHAALRRRLAPLFAPAAVESLVAAGLGAATRGLSEALGRGESVDLVAHARRGASAVIARLVGLEPEEGAATVVDDELFRRVAAITGYVTLARPRLTPRQVARAREVLEELGAHARRAYAGDESTVPGRMRALGLDEREALGAVGAFVLTGTETIVSSLPRIAALLIDSGLLGWAGEDPARADAAIQEGLRVTTPSPMMLRAATRPGRIGDVAVREGDRILLGTWWADRAGGDFDPERNPAASLKQLWFGAGAHYCLGAPLAMAQLRLALGALLAHPRLEVAARRPARGVLIPGYAELTVRVP